MHFFLLFVVHVRTKGIGKVSLKRCTTKNLKEYYHIFWKGMLVLIMAETLNSPTVLPSQPLAHSHGTT